MTYIYIYGNIRSSRKRCWGNQQNGRKVNGQEEEEESSIRKKYVMGKMQKKKKEKRTI